MNLKTVDCNLLDSDAEVIAHCANCFNTMRSGVAAAIVMEYPEAQKVDVATKSGDRKKLGTVSLSVVEDITIHKNQNIKAIANIYGQYNFGSFGTRYLDYDAMFNGLMDLKSRLKPTITKIAFPFKIGCDRAGGDWRIVEKMIEVVFEDTNLDVIICKYTPPAN